MKNARILLFLILFSFYSINANDYYNSVDSTDYYDSVDSTSYFPQEPSPIIIIPGAYIDSTIPSNKTEGNPRIILLRLESFKIEVKINFNVIFRRIYGTIPTKLK